MKLLIVDDNKDIVETLKMIAQKEGFTYDWAYNGEEFIKKSPEFKPDLVLLDVMMPGLNTTQILERLHEEHIENIKIIMLTVVRFTDEERAALMQDKRVVDYITKPFDVVDLVARIRRQVSS